MTQRDQLKSILKKIILSEIMRADYGVGRTSTDTALIDELNKALKSAAGDDAVAKENPLNNKIVFDDGHGGSNFQVEVVRASDKGDLFNIVAFFHGADRFVAKNFTKSDLITFIKDELKTKEDKKSYVDKSLEKGKSPIEKKSDKKDDGKKEKEEKLSDKMEDSKETTQKDIADKADKDAEQDSEVDDISPALGGELVDKIEKIIDRVLKDKTKSDAKSSYLKADSDKESPDKLVVKSKETPKLKEKKS